MANFTHAALHKTKQKRASENKLLPKKKKKGGKKESIHILKVLDHAKTPDSGSLSTFGLQMLQKAGSELGSALWGKKSKAVGVELGISWSGEEMRSVIRML